MDTESNEAKFNGWRLIYPGLMVAAYELVWGTTIDPSGGSPLLAILTAIVVACFASALAATVVQMLRGRVPWGDASTDVVRATEIPIWSACLMWLFMAHGADLDARDLRPDDRAQRRHFNGFVSHAAGLPKLPFYTQSH